MCDITTGFVLNVKVMIYGSQELHFLSSVFGTKTVLTLTRAHIPYYSDLQNNFKENINLIQVGYFADRSDIYIKRNKTSAYTEN
jgi:hypothetical protein